ncbi:hypothetical protein MVA48_00610 [Blastococcus sp. PRF04-17]|nr:hypothetical protein [Blastococcus sp. PRF04-17]UOY01921.1 hypothetical protein MVA48_00610 [Blastococcus sp. PRF04-17]
MPWTKTGPTSRPGSRIVEYSSAIRPCRSTRAIATSTIRSPLAGEKPVVSTSMTANSSSSSKPGPSPP